MQNFTLTTRFKNMHSKVTNKLRAKRTAHMSLEEIKLLVKYFLVHNSTTVN